MRQLALLATFMGLMACSDAEPDAPTTPLADDLIFVAVEDDGTLAVVDEKDGTLLRTVDLSEQAHGSTMRFTVHNVQAHGDTVWLTALPVEEAGGHGGEEQLIGVDTTTLQVSRRITLGEELHVAHVVLRDSTAFVTAYEADQVLVVDLDRGLVDRAIDLPSGTGPHGARLTPDGKTLIVAGMAQGHLVTIDLGVDRVVVRQLPGRAVQTAVLPDGSAAFATIYDTRQVARLDLASDELQVFDLPADSAGPVQLYPSPDSGSLWVADQGLLGDDPAGNRLYRLDAASGVVTATAQVASAPHGVVVNAEGTQVFTTTLVDGALQRIDAVSGAVLSTTPVGKRPNGVSCWHGGQAMP